MKKITVAVTAVLLLFATVFAGCKGADSGKVTDNNNPVPGITDMTSVSSSASTSGTAGTTDTLPEIVSSQTVS